MQWIIYDIAIFVNPKSQISPYDMNTNTKANSRVMHIITEKNLVSIIYKNENSFNQTSEACY